MMTTRKKLPNIDTLGDACRSIRKLEALLHTALRKIGALEQDALQIEADRDVIKLLVQARNDQSLRLGEVENQWRQHAKVSMERYQETRALQTAVMNANERVSSIGSRLHSAEMQLATHRGLLYKLTEPAAPAPAEQWVLSFGNPSDGFEYVGPFATATDAIDYAEKWMPNQEWWTILLQAPAKGD